MSSQGKMLANVIKFIVSNIENEKERAFRDNLEHLARVHNERGISASQFSIMGVVLIQAIRECIGEAFTESTRVAWVLIYSRMMEVIIPEVVSGRLPDHESEESKQRRAIYAVDDSKSTAQGKSTRRPSHISRNSQNSVSKSNLLSAQAAPVLPNSFGPDSDQEYRSESPVDSVLRATAISEAGETPRSFIDPPSKYTGATFSEAGETLRSVIDQPVKSSDGHTNVAHGADPIAVSTPPQRFASRRPLGPRNNAITTAANDQNSPLGSDVEGSDADTELQIADDPSDIPGTVDKP